MRELAPRRMRQHFSRRRWVARGRPRGRAGGNGQVKAIADTDAAMLGFAGRQLDDGFRASRTGRPPRAQAIRDFDDFPGLVDEDNVDREAHEERVDRRCRPQQQAFTARKRSPAQQPAHARERRVGNEASLADQTPRRSQLNRFHASHRETFARRRRLAGETGFPPRLSNPRIQTTGEPEKKRRPRTTRSSAVLKKSASDQTAPG